MRVLKTNNHTVNPIIATDIPVNKWCFVILRHYVLHENIYVFIFFFLGNVLCFYVWIVFDD